MSDFEYFEMVEKLIESNIKAMSKKAYMPKVKQAQDMLKELKDETTKRVLNAEKSKYS